MEIINQDFPESVTEPAKAVDTARKKKLDVLCITDHKPMLDAPLTIDLIHEQGGGGNRTPLSECISWSKGVAAESIKMIYDSLRGRNARIYYTQK